MSLRRIGVAIGVIWSLLPSILGGDWLVFPGERGPGAGKRVVLISGDEEYRSEEALPMLARILADRHGFSCTVLFAISEGIINPNNQNNIPGLEALADADLMIIATRFRNLPDAQMRYIDTYLKRGGPVIGLRTATHAFDIPAGRTYSRYGNGYEGDPPAWVGGFGRLVLGEHWIAHHGEHGKQATRGMIVDSAQGSPLVRGCEDIFALTDVYAVRLPLPGDSRVLVRGAVLEGMEPTDPPVKGAVNAPMMPVAWTRSYQLDGGSRGRVFATTMGAGVDFKSEGLRRLVVNAAYWCVGLEARIPPRADVDFIGTYEPSGFGFRETGYWMERRLRPADLLGPAAKVRN